MKKSISIKTNRHNRSYLSLRAWFLSLFLLVIVLLDLTANPLHAAIEAQYTIDGIEYSLSYEQLSYTADPAEFSTSSMPWWGDQSLALDFASVVQGFGEVNQGLGVIFAYGMSDCSLYCAQNGDPLFEYWLEPEDPSYTAYYAVGTVVPEAGWIGLLTGGLATLVAFLAIFPAWRVRLTQANAGKIRPNDNFA